MWSLRTTLQRLSQTGHLPAGFQIGQGVRLLFPVAQTDGVRISSLKNFTYSQTGRVVLEAIAASFYVAADGAGNWVLQGGITAGTEPGGEECKWGAGFVFQFSRDSSGHGFVATGDDFNPNAGKGKPVELDLLVQGKGDFWLSANWPDVFAKGVFLYLSDATGFNSLPDTANAATNHGFSGLTQLQGATPVTTNYVQAGGNLPSPPSGPGGVDWNIPPTDDGGDDGGG